MGKICEGANGVWNKILKLVMQSKMSNLKFMLNQVNFDKFICIDRTIFTFDYLNL